MNTELNRVYDLGHEYEREYGNCAQCVLAALSDFFGLEDCEAVFKAATALSGGTAGMGDGNCGAYSGAALALGLMCGRERKDFANPRKAKHASDLARKLHSRFLEEYGGVRCHDVQQKVFGRTFNLQDRADYQAFEEAGAHKDKCPDVVGKAALWTAKIVLDDRNRAEHQHSSEQT
jgi:C_GCAxxG_C_C family probable redox protein